MATLLAGLHVVVGCGTGPHRSVEGDRGNPADFRVHDSMVSDVEVAPPINAAAQLIWSSFNRGVPVYPEAWHSGSLGAQTVALHDGLVDVVKPVTECGGRRHVFRSSMSAVELEQVTSLGESLRNLESVSASCDCLGDCALEQIQIVAEARTVVVAGSPTLRGVSECDDRAAASVIPSAAIALADALGQHAGDTAPDDEVVPRRIRLGRIIPPDGRFPNLVPTEWPFSEIDVFADISDVENRPYVIDDPVLAERVWKFFTLAEASWPPGHECERGLFVTVAAAGEVANIAASPLLDGEAH